GLAAGVVVLAGAVAAAAGELGFAQGGGGGGQLGGEGVEGGAGDAGDGGVGQPGQVRRGRGRRCGGAARGACRPGGQDVVPVAVPAVRGDRQGGHLLVADLGPGGVGAGVELGVHA